MLTPVFDRSWNSSDSEPSAKLVGKNGVLEEQKSPDVEITRQMKDGPIVFCRTEENVCAVVFFWESGGLMMRSRWWECCEVLDIRSPSS
ncbi:hypothetical protein P7K49_037387 [Saguinus oedipus]|uniref:Uncharacterized protein n=1 Tax=Saguinus oedipus TaxID=9490 RepID=A0ABQ9THZ0_SAGOE|nr:hypothetical protein P7K49_037387 [Saguinus oedipus]